MSIGRENGDLRFDRPGPRILLQRNDSAFVPLRHYRRQGDSIFFDAGRYHDFAGVVTDTEMSGTARDGAEAPLSWIALPLTPGSSDWPVPPRITIRQLAVGVIDTIQRIPGDWLAAAPDPASLRTEYMASAAALGVTPRPTDPLYAQEIVTGLDSATRRVTEQVLRQILDSSHDPVLRAQFTTRYGVRIDIHDRAVELAGSYLIGFSLADAARGLAELGQLTPDSSLDATHAALLRLWQVHGVDDSLAVQHRIDSLAQHDDRAAQSLRALLAAYDEADDWWRASVIALLTRPWLDDGHGARSPAQLMAEFWGVDSLPLPAIVTERLDGAMARPVIGAGPVAAHLVRPDNAVAPEWLAHGGVRDAIDAWARLAWGPPLPVQQRGHVRVVLSPVQMRQARPAFLGGVDQIRVDPAMTPLIAVAVVLHEWQHLLVDERRLEGAHPLALRETAMELQLRDDNPWLAEGFAEWATDRVLQSGGPAAALLRYSQAAKRQGLAVMAPDDPHILGYRLVLALDRRMPAAALRNDMIAHMDDLGAVARLVRLSASSRTAARNLPRPATAAVIPEVSFAWDGGIAINPSRRLLIPNSGSEP